MIDTSLGRVSVVTSSGEEHTPEAYARRMAMAVISVADTAPAPIRDQALSFQKEIQSCLLSIVRDALDKERRNAVSTLKENGMEIAAMLIRKV